MGCNYKGLLESYAKLPARRANSLMEQAFKSGSIKPSDIDLGRLFEACYGTRAFNNCRRRHGEYLATHYMTGQRVAASHTGAVLEAGGAVTTGAFQNITSQIIYNAFIDKYELEDFMFTKLIPVVQSEFRSERIAGITGIGDESEIVGELEPYPLVGVGEDWIDTPLTQKRGMICPVSWEAIFYDRTGLLLERVGKVGEWQGLNKEKRAIDTIIDENGGAKSAQLGGHRYHWRGNSIASYGNNSGTHSWDNLEASNGLLDWSDVNAALITLRAILDPDTGEATNWKVRDLIVTPTNDWIAQRILSATEIRVATPGYATTGNPTQTIAPNPVREIRLHVSQLLANRLATDTDWFIGDVATYAAYMQNQEMKVVQAPPNSLDEFHRDIVMQFKAWEVGAFMVKQPRAIVKSTQ